MTPNDDTTPTPRDEFMALIEQLDTPDLYLLVRFARALLAEAQRPAALPIETAPEAVDDQNTPAWVKSILGKN